VADVRTGTPPVPATGAQRQRSGRLASRAVAMIAALGSALLLGTPAAASDPPDVRSPVVLVGAGALTWADITEDTAPTLHALAGPHAVGNVSVRTVRTRTCPVDGWLTIGAGRRTADEPMATCAPVPEPRSAPGGGVTVGRWDVLADPPDASRYQAQSGLLGDALAADGQCATAVGPGATLALADSTGRVQRYLADVSQLTSDDIDACAVTVVDAGSVPHLDGDQARQAAVARIDGVVAKVERLLPAEGTLLVAGISDSGPTAVTPEGPEPLPNPALRLGLAAGGDFAPRWLVSSSTRWDTVVQITDVTATLFEAAQLPFDATLAGSGWRNDGSHPAKSQEAIEELVGLDTAEKIFRKRYGDFYPLLGYVQAGVYGLTLILIGLRERRSRSGPTLTPTTIVAYVAASIPAASFLTNLTGWWRFSSPELALWSILLLLSLAIAGAAAFGPWRRVIYGPPTAIAALTATVLAVDVLTGSRLQHLSLLGLSPTVAGRFFGFGNIPSAVYAASVLVVLASVVQLLRDRGASPMLQAGTVLVVGIPAALLAGSPRAGADFGGLLSLAPGVLVLALGVAGGAITLGRLLLIGLVSGVAVTIVSVIDWLRPPEQRSHLGDFIESLVDGSALNTIARKFDSMVGTLDNTYSWLVPVAYVLIWALVLSKSRPTLPALEHLESTWTTFRPLVIALLTTGAVGFAVNDSGMIVPAMLGSTSIPLAVIALVRAREAVGRQAGVNGTGQPRGQRAP
jgi:hypothetical protein